MLSLEGGILGTAGTSAPTCDSLLSSASNLSPGDRLEVEWPCMYDCGAEGVTNSSAIEGRWFTASVVSLRQTSNQRPRFLLRFDDDNSEVWHSLRKLPWRRVAAADNVEDERVDGGKGCDGRVGSQLVLDQLASIEVVDKSGFIHEFGMEEKLVCFCEFLHEVRDAYGDKTRGSTSEGEPLHGGLVSVVLRREALPASEREMYHVLHQRCIDEIPKAWPDWLRQAAGRAGRARQSQDLRLLQYSEGSRFEVHVDSGWACQALIYLNDAGKDFTGGSTCFPNLGAAYRPRRGRVLLWRSVCVGHRPLIPGSWKDHPAAHVAGEVHGGIKRVVSLHFVLA